MKDEVIRAIKAFPPYNEQEARDRQVILELLSIRDDLFLRENLSYHMTASAWVVNPGRDRVLMAYHNLYNSWAWLGGHADGETDLLAVALREVREESGISAVSPVSGDIYSVEILTVDGHEKRGKYVPSHLHLNVTYLLEADDRQPLRVKADENSAVGWMTPEEAVSRSTEPWFQARIYSKLNEKLRNYPAR